MKKWKRGLKRITAIALAAILVGTTVDMTAFTVYAAEGAQGEGTVTAYGVGDTFTVDNLEYEILTEPEGDNPGTVSLSDCSESSIWEVIIPDSVTNPDFQTKYTVTNIGDSAFLDCESLSYVTIPDSVTSIGAKAFYHCASLGSVTIPDSVTGIGEFAFGMCWSLSDVTIGNSVTSIGDSAFSGCFNLSYVIISDSVTSIGNSAFLGCESLSSVTIPASVTSIGDGAFGMCSNLTTINVDLNNNAYASDEGVLFTEDMKTLVACPNGKTGEYTIPASVTTIGDYAFTWCSGLPSITIPDSVTSIGIYAFEGCESLSSVTIPDSVTSIGDYVFGSCRSLSSVTIGNSVTSIGIYAFEGCESLTSVSVPCTWNSESPLYDFDISIVTVRAHDWDNSICNVCNAICYHTSTFVYSHSEDNEMTIIASCGLCGAEGTATISVASKTYDGTTAEVTVTKTEALENVDIPVAYAKNGITLDSVPVNAGSYKASITLGEGENVVTASVDFEIQKATPSVVTPPSASAITYGDTLSMSQLTNGVVQSSTTVAGSFAWKNGSVKPYVSDSNSTTYTVVFTPVDTTNYKVVETAITLAVNKAKNAPNMPGNTISAPYSNKTVGAVTLPTGWAWQDADKETALEVGVSVNATAVYTGTDKGNYENETVEITITRSTCVHSNTEVRDAKKATCTASGYTGDTYCKDCEKSIATGTKIAMKDHTGGTATCTKKAVCSVCGKEYGSVDSSKHGGTEVRGAKKATCTARGYTGDTCCKDCGVKIASGTTTEKLKHSYKDVKVAKKATTKKNGTMNQKCSSCGTTRNISIYAVKTVKLSTTSYTYNGKVKTPSVTVKDSKGNKLKNKTDYTVSYAKGRKNVGKYTVTITLKGKYSGTIKETFTIKPMTTSISKLSAAKKGFTVKWKKQQSQTTGYEIQYSTSSKFTKNTTKTVKITKNSTISKSITKLKEKKKYYVRVRTYKTVKVNGKSTKIYSDWSKSKTVTTKK